MSTASLSAKDIKREYRYIDAKGKILGKVASEAAIYLMGKHKTNFVPYLDTGDYVVVINAAKVKVSGNKMRDKKYTRHSGFPGGLKVESLEQLLARQPEKVIEHAVWGMVPKTKLGRKMVKKLRVFAGAEHPFKEHNGETE